MKVILLKNIENIGKKYEIKEIKNGYAKNFLIPKGFVKPLNKESLRWLETQKKIQAKKAEESLKKIQGLASAIEGQEIFIPVKVGEKNQLFESITSQKISEELKRLGYEVKRTQIDLEKPIKEIGEFPVKIKFEHNLEAEIRVIVAEEK